MTEIRTFVIIGPESTGKSTLCKKLADFYRTLWVKEYARQYLEENGKNYIYEDLLKIAKGQIALEEKVLEEASLNKKADKIFIDTDMYVMEVWCEYVFNKCYNWILNRIAERKYSGYLLCGIDLPWIQDELREYPNKKIREKLYLFYKEIMANQNVPWVEISGDYEERFEKAKNFIEKHS
jgi:NadR type nicotinamide-nucleotide adenylyltransferase